MRLAIPEAGFYSISSERDRQNAARITDLITTDANAFGRDENLGHVTASAFVVNPARTAVLLTHHAKLGRWLQLGGHCDGIRDPYFVALKEAYEESGLPHITALGRNILDIDIHEIPASPGHRQHLHFDIRYLFEADDQLSLSISSESNDLQWIALSELEARGAGPSVTVMRSKLEAFLSHAQ